MLRHWVPNYGVTLTVLHCGRVLNTIGTTLSVTLLYCTAVYTAVYTAVLYCNAVIQCSPAVLNCGTSSSSIPLY